MPELPEVETARRRLEKALKGHRIEEVKGDDADKFLFKANPAKEVKKALEGAKVISTGRRGKYFWINFDRKPSLLLHLGMSGDVEIRKAKAKSGFDKGWGGLKLWQSKNRRAPTDIPFFTRMMITMDNGTRVALTDPRRFGRVWLTEDPEKQKSVAALGFDPLVDFPTAKKLGEILGKRKAPIKAILLDQSLFAGVGNYLADEVLFQSKLSPKRTGASLTAAEVSRLRSKVLAVIKKAVSVEADYELFPKDWLFHQRWGKKKTAQTTSKQKIVHETIGGRTTAWVPTLQK